jgi:hypothetical protein
MSDDLLFPRLLEGDQVHCTLDGEEVRLNLVDYQKLCRARRRIERLRKMAKATLSAKTGSDANAV